jgi:hypothetical protein
MGEYVNSQTVRFDRSHISCGVIEAHHLPENTSRTVFAIANHLYNKANPRPGSFIVFSDVVDGDTKRGLRLAEAIKKLKCGELIESPKAVNPRTGNVIQAWIFAVDHEAFRKWYQDELANRIEE